MADKADEDVGPRLVWTFPLATRVQRRTRVFNIGNNVLSIFDSFGSSEDDSSPDVASYGEDEDTNDLQRQLDEVGEAGSDVFSGLGYGEDDDYSQSGQSAEVVIEGGVAIPTVVEIQEGETVTWINEDGTTRRIRSVRGEDFDSGQLEDGDVYQHQFESEGAVVYVDTISGGSQLSGAVVVGDADRPDSLPSESDVEPVPFGGTTNGSPQSMSDAAEEVDSMITGFN